MNRITVLFSSLFALSLVAAPANQNTATAPAKKSSIVTQVEVATGMTNTGSLAQPGLNVAFNSTLEKNPAIAIGGEFGAFVYGGDDNGALIPILLTAQTSIALSNTTNLVLGIAPGIVIDQFSGSNEVRLAVIFRPGLNFQVSKGLQVSLSPRIGALDGKMLFAPLIGTVWTL